VIVVAGGGGCLLGAAAWPFPACQTKGCTRGGPEASRPAARLAGLQGRDDQLLEFEVATVQDPMLVDGKRRK